MAKNRYTRALKVLKSSQVDEKLQILEALPTNNTTGLYVVEPAIINTVTVPGEVDRIADFTQDGDGSEGYSGNDTTGLFLSDGTILTIEPPGDTSYILGPMSSMWYAWGNFTQIGYIRQSDRKMVNLARITGELGSWDGSSNFTSYGQLTLDQAVWFQGTPKLNGADNDTPNYRAFYPGPPSNTADEFGRYLAVITGTTKATEREETQRTPDVMGDAESQGYPWEKRKEEEQDENDKLMQTILNAAMLGLDIVAVLALLFPEPASSAAGAAHLATKLRYVAKLRRFRGALNPFGQRAVRSGAAGRVRRQVYSGRPYQGKRGFGKTTYGTTNRATARTYSNPGPLKGTPGTGSRVNPRGTVDTGTLPQRYIDKYGSRSVLGQKQVKLGPKAAKRTFGEDYEYVLEQINKMKLLETATAVPSLSGGMEAADGYVDKVSETSSPEQLEKASNDANNIAKEGGKGLSDGDLAKIDKDAEAEAKRLTNFDISNPESMDADQLNASTEMMYEIDPDWLMESFGRNESLIDTVKLDKLYNEYTERRSYIGSLEHGFSISPEFKRYYNQAEYLHNTYVSQIHFGTDGNGYPQVTNKNTGEILGGSDLLVKKLREWSGLFTKTWDTFNSKTVRDRVNKDREENENNYRKQSDILFRPFYIQVIREWSQRGADINDDPFSIKDYINQQFGNSMSEAEKKELKKLLQKLGITKVDIGSYKDNEKLRPQGPSTPVYYDKHMKQIVPTGNEGQILNDMLKKAKNNNNQSLVAHFEPKFLKNRERKNLTEIVTPKQKRILREIKIPFEIKEAPTKFKVKPTGRNNKVVGAELMNPIENPKAFKPDPAIWKAGHKKYNEISSQDKKNHVLELVGAAEHHWSTLIERSDRERQEKVNEAMAQEFDREMEKLYEKYQKKETKVDKVIQSIKTASLDKSNIKSVHPDEPPPERVNGYHPKYGQKYKHDKLDPHSAEFMPDTGNPTIDANIRKSTDQEKKNRKVGILRSNQENLKKKVNTKIKERYSVKKAKQIALQEQQYLLYFIENVVPKHYDWKTGQFSKTPLTEIKGTVLKRLEEIDNALSEGMKMKHFNYLYGGEISSMITSINPTLVSSTFAQDLISASGEVTSTMFGPDFPGSHINSIGDFDKPESLSKADINMMAVPTPAGDAISWNPFDQTLPTNYQLGNSTPTDASLDNTAALMVSRGETTDTHTDIYYTPNISQTDDVITLQSGSGNYQELNANDLMRLTGLYVGNNVTKPNGMFTDLPGFSPGGDNANQKFVVPELIPMPYGYDKEDYDPDHPDEDSDGGEPSNVVPMLRTFNNKSAGDQITFEWEFNAGNTNVSNPNNTPGDGDFDASSWVYINGDNKFYKLANIYDHDTLRIGDDDFYADTVGGHYDEDGDAVGFDDGDTRQDNNATRKSIRPEFRSGGSGKANGSFAYTVKSGDIDSNGNFKMWVLMSLTNRTSDSLRITGMTGTASAADKRKQGAGKLGQTTDAYDLGYRVQTPEEIRKLLKGVDVDELKILSGDVDITAGEFKKVLEKNPQVASAFKKLLTQGMVFKDYLTGNLPDVIDNKYLGQKYVNSIFKDAEINSNGTISVGDNIVGTGGKATYNKKTGEVTIPFNYDFKKNTEEFRDPSKAGHLEGPMGQVRKAVLNAVGDYNVDATPVTGLPAPLNAVDTFSGIMFGAAISASKALGGAKHKPGNVTMSADKLEKINPLLHSQLVGFGGKLKEELYPGQPSPNGFPDTPPPKMAPNGYHPEYGKRSNRYRRLDPVSAVVMNKVGTEDPETNKQVAAAAKKPKVKINKTGKV